jgi:BioD-like phosphotransacetylase family protein
VTGGDRLDIQLAALETSTRCLILTGNLYPSSVILSRAEEVGVPVVLVRQDTLTAVEMIDRYRGRMRFHQAKKVDIFNRVLTGHFSFSRLYRDLGLAPRASSAQTV